jgi:uncharacterized protein (TIGR02757 family)
VSARLAEVLAAIDRDCDRGVRTAADPVSFAIAARDRGASLATIELTALVGSCLAFGNVTTIRAKISEVLSRAREDLATVADDRAALRSRLRGFKHRLYVGADLEALLVGARAVQRAHGSLGAFVGARLHARDDDLIEALADLVEAIRREGGLDQRATRGARHLLPDPRATSASKRLLLFCRWMVRDDDADLGLWRAHLKPAQLLIPVDVHLHRLGRNLRLTDRASADLRASREITAGLRAVDPIDPVRFDFVLCHYGMTAIPRCPSRRDATLCEGCLLKPACRWWSKPR